MALLQLQRACERFRSHLSDEETRRVENVKSVEDVREAISQIEHYLASRQKLRNFERLVPFLDAADRLTKPIDVLSNGVPFLPYIWAPLKLILQISQDHTHALDKILAAYSRIGASLPRFSRYGNAFPDSHDFQQLLGHIYEDIIDFHCHAYRLVQKPGWVMLFSTCWGRFQHRFDSLIESIDTTSQLIDREAASYEIVQAREWRQKALEKAQDQEKKEELYQREAVNKWLQVSDRNEEKLERLHNRCLDGTSQWVTGSPQVRSWLQKGRGKPVLWLHGKPGSGKSILCSQLIYFLRSNPTWKCLFFFCDYHSTGYGVTVQVLRSICAQILDLVPETASFMYKECVVSGKTPSTSFLKELIPKLFSFFDDLRLIIDGIDEIVSSEHGELIKTLTKLAETQENFRLLISSQDIPSIARNLKGRPTLIVGKQSASVCKDIGLIVSNRLETIREGLDGHVPQSVFTEIRETILKRAEGMSISPKREKKMGKTDGSAGMFLWVHLVLQVLETTDSIQELRSSVEAFPKDLEEAYYKTLTSIISRCQATDVSKLRRIFGWMVFSKGGQPMRRFELRLGRILHADSTIINEKTKPFSNVLDLCKPFIEDGPGATMVFIHATVPKFLQAQSSGPFINKEDSCRDITTACIAQLTQSLALADETMERLQHLYCVAQGFYGLLPYAHEHWIEHLLEYLELSQGFCTPDSSRIQGQLMALARSWIGLVGEEATRISNAESLDPRLHWLESLPSARALVQGTLVLRKATKESVETVPSPRDATLLSSVRTRYHTYVVDLLTGTNCPGLLAKNLIAFKEEYGPTAFVCSIYGCDKAVVGYSSALQLKDHSARHQEKLRCFSQDCFYNDVGFTSLRQFNDHQRRCHPSPPLPSIPRQIPQRPGQGSQAPATSLANAKQDRQELQYGASNQAPILATVSQQSPPETSDYKSSEAFAPSPAYAPTHVGAQQAPQATQLTTEERFLSKPQLGFQISRQVQRAMRQHSNWQQRQGRRQRPGQQQRQQRRRQQQLQQQLQLQQQQQLQKGYLDLQLQQQQQQQLQKEYLDLQLRKEFLDLQLQRQQQPPQLQQNGMPADMVMPDQLGMPRNMPSNQDPHFQVTLSDDIFANTRSRFVNLAYDNSRQSAAPMSQDSIIEDIRDQKWTERGIEQDNMGRASAPPMPTPQAQHMPQRPLPSINIDLTPPPV